MITISLRVLIRNLKNSTSDREFKSEMKPKIDVSNERKKKNQIEQVYLDARRGDGQSRSVQRAEQQ